MMDYSITEESFDSLAAYWAGSGQDLDWSSVFVLPAWLKVWWREYKPEAELYLATIRQGDKIIGIAPLQIKDARAALIGSIDVCDYLDFVITPEREGDFYSVLLGHMRRKGIGQLDLGLVRPDSTILTHLVGMAQNQGYEVVSKQEDTSLELDLPSTWDDYLATLTTKQRHELRRKLRRLSEAGEVDFRWVKAGENVNDLMDAFLRLFSESREDKARFLTPQRESFFRSLSKAMAEIGLLRFGILDLDKQPVAMVICFDYNDCIYLYNSGYDTNYSSLSVGLLCKAFSIKEGIQQNKKRFDFLKGDEVYKYHLGGGEIPLYNCQIKMAREG